MGIQGFGQYDAFASNYRINEIPRVEANPIQTDPVPSKQEDISKNLTPAVPIEEDTRPRSVDPNEVSISFNKNDDFSYIGKDKDLQTMDIQKAISDMKQDSILQEYQYFVGSSQNMFQSEDGIVLQKL